MGAADWQDITIPAGAGPAAFDWLESRGIEAAWWGDSLRTRGSVEDAEAALADLTVAWFAQQRAGEVDQIARDKREQFIGSYHPAEMASWSIKEVEARAGAGSLIEAEAAARGVSVADISARIIANADAYRAAEAAVAGTAGRHKDALAACETFEAVAAYDIRAGWPF